MAKKADEQEKNDEIPEGNVNLNVLFLYPMLPQNDDEEAYVWYILYPQLGIVERTDFSGITNIAILQKSAFARVFAWSLNPAAMPKNTRMDAEFDLKFKMMTTNLPIPREQFNKLVSAKSAQ